MKQMLLVAKETYLRQVKSWFFVMMLLAPFILMGLSIGVGYLSSQNSKDNATIALVTENPAVKASLKELKNYKPYASEKAAKKAVKDEKAGAYLLVTEKSGQLEAVYHSKQYLTSQQNFELNQVLQGLQSQLNLQEAKLDQNQTAILARQAIVTEKVKADENLAVVGKTITFMALAFFSYTMIASYSGTTATEIASEKGTKIMEVILSSVPAAKYFYGRILGIFGVIVTHIGLYAIGGSLIYKLIQDKDFFVSTYKPMFEAILKNLDWTLALYAILAIMFYVVLSALCGSLVIRQEDINKAIQPIILFVMAGFFGAISLQNSADILILKIGSYVPFTSVFLMPIRFINGYAGNLEVWLSLAILLATLAGTTYFIGKSYAGLILQTDDIGLIKSLKRGLAHR